MESFLLLAHNNIRLKIFNKDKKMCLEMWCY